MRPTIRAAIVVIALAIGGMTPVCAAGSDAFSGYALQASGYYRTELYFGRSIPGGGAVSDNEWENFLSEVVTVRFPGGFTVLDARGQYMQQDDEVIKEPTKIVVFFYPARTRTASRRKIEEIRRAYIKRFKQESVLRLDFPGLVDVRF